MSDIKDYTPPDEDGLADYIYFTNWRIPLAVHGAEARSVTCGTYGGSSGGVKMRRFKHTKRVCGYLDGDVLYLLGDEKISEHVEAPPHDFYYGGVYTSTSQPLPTFPLKVPNTWSDHDKPALSDQWNIGGQYGVAEGYFAPKKLSEQNYGLIFDNHIFRTFFTQGASSDYYYLTLSTDLTKTARLRGLSEFDETDGSTAYHYDSSIGGYAKAIRGIFSSLERAYNYAVGDFYVQHDNLQPEGWWLPPDSISNLRSSFLLASFANLIITTSYIDAVRYIEDGTLPKDYVYDSPDDDPNTTPDGGDDNNESDGNAGSDVRDDISVNLPTADAVSLSNINIYALTREQLLSFISDMWNFSWTELATNMMTGIYNNLVDNVQSIRVLPFPASELGVVDTADKIICGWWTHSATVQIIKTNIAGGAMPRVSVGSYDLKEVFGGWADYSPYTTVDLYLPYHGEVRLDTNLFMQHTINIEYVIDVLMGLITYFISCDNTVVMSISAKVSADVPVSLASGIDTFTDVLNNNAHFVESAGMLRPVGMVTGSTSVATEKLVNQSSQSGMFYMPCKCHVRITRPAYTRASNYASRYGYPCYGSYKLSALKGFTVVENYKGSYSKGIEKEEADEIKRQLEEGIYL